jgi:adenylosuccinate lyase
VVPKSAAKALWDWWATNPAIDVAAIDAIEAVTKHDVIAFLTWVAEQVGDEARFMHQGMTSSDVLDTCLAVQLARASDILLADIDRCSPRSSAAPIEHKLTPTIGRSHGIHAEPVTFGLKLAEAYAEFSATRSACSPPAPTSPPARSPARSAPSPISIRASKRMSPRSSASPSSRSRPR